MERINESWNARLCGAPAPVKDRISQAVKRPYR
jgi:hypothetical protein